MIHTEQTVLYISDINKMVKVLEHELNKLANNILTTSMVDELASMQHTYKYISSILNGLRYCIEDEKQLEQYNQDINNGAH